MQTHVMRRIKRLGEFKITIKTFCKTTTCESKNNKSSTIFFASKLLSKIICTSNKNTLQATTMEPGHCSLSAERTEGVGKLLIKYAYYCSL